MYHTLCMQNTIKVSFEIIVKIIKKYFFIEHPKEKKKYVQKLFKFKIYIFYKVGIYYTLLYL